MTVWRHTLPKSIRPSAFFGAQHMGAIVCMFLALRWRHDKPSVTLSLHDLVLWVVGSFYRWRSWDTGRENSMTNVILLTSYNWCHCFFKALVHMIPFLVSWNNWHILSLFWKWKDPSSGASKFQCSLQGTTLPCLSSQQLQVILGITSCIDTLLSVSFAIWHLPFVSFSEQMLQFYGRPH